MDDVIDENINENTFREFARIYQFNFLCLRRLLLFTLWFSKLSLNQQSLSLPFASSKCEKCGFYIACIFLYIFYLSCTIKLIPIMLAFTFKNVAHF